MWHNVFLFVPLKIFLLIFLGEFKGIFSYFRLPDLIKITSCLSIFSFVLLVLRVCFPNNILLPGREIILSDLLFSILFILFFRASLRIIINGQLKPQQQNQEHLGMLRIAVIGTNDFASQIVAELKTKRVYNMVPVAILDDNRQYFGRNLHGVPVLGVPELINDLVEKKNIEGVLFVGNALPSKRLQTLAQLAKDLHLKTFTVPALKDFLAGKAFASRLRPLDVEDFLSRDPIHLNLDDCKKFIENKVICITGAGGSIGSELTYQVAQKCPKTLIIIDHSEFNLFKIQQRLLREGYHCIPILLNVSQGDAVRACLEKYKPDAIFHAAAYKHVPMLEDQPLIAVKNNVLSTGYLALYASELGIKRFVLISTDKAINPINNMGATKRICEMICMAMQQRPGNKTDFMAVRFGNVLGSAGSVLPTFREQIARGGPVTVTHPQMTRFFMSIPEAVSLILEAFSFKDIANKTFVLDMGKPVKILDVAKQMIELNGLQPGVDIDITYTGIRPGEKLHEDLIFNTNNILPTDNKLIGVFKEDLSYVNKMKSISEYLEEVQKLKTNEDSIRFIQELIPEFKQNEIQL